MVKKLRRKGDASAAPAPKADAPGPAKKTAVESYLENLKAAVAESAGTAEASASAQKPIEASPVSAAAAGNGGVPLSGGEDRKAKEPMRGREQEKASASAQKRVEASPASAAAAGNGGVALSGGEDRKAREPMRGREQEKGKGQDRKTSRKDEDSARREEKRRRRTAGEEEEENDERGYIFMCSARTKPECYRSGVFGLPRGKMDVVEKIRPGAKLFLYDFDLKLMYGVYKADTRGGLDLVRHAFEGKFPAQVKFSVDIDCLPIPESSFKHAIKENYNSKGRFTQELSPKQVHRLLEIFQPIGRSQPAPQHIKETRRPLVEDRRESLQERGIPIHAHPYPLEDHYKITHSLCPPLLDEPRRILVPDPYHMQEPQHVPPKYYHQVSTSSLNHQPYMDILHERTAAEATVRDPLLARDYGALPGELAARSEHVDELYRSYKLSTRDMDLQPGPSYVSPYENSRSLYYGESLQRPVVARVRGPSVPVSSRYSFGPPS